jgi:hypothetical protein
MEKIKPAADLEARHQDIAHGRSLSGSQHRQEEARFSKDEAA